MRMFMKKRVVTFATVMSAVLGLAGCVGGETKEKESNAATIIPVRIDPATFPDPAFREYIGRYFDLNEDKVLNEEEISKAKMLNIAEWGVKSLEGVEWLTELTFIDCSLASASPKYYRSYTPQPNKIKELDVSKNKELEALYCDGNDLTTLDVSHNPKLVILSCEGNDLTELDVSNNRSLGALDCQGNPLTAINVGNNTKLASLDVSESVEVSGAGEMLRLTKHDAKEYAEKEEGWFIRYDDGLINDLSSAVQTLLEDDKYASVDHNTVLVAVDQDGAIEVSGMPMSLIESFIEGVYLKTYEQNGPVDNYRSRGYGEGGNTTVVFTWSDYLQEYDYEIKNNIVGSAYYDEDYEADPSLPNNYGGNNGGSNNSGGSGNSGGSNNSGVPGVKTRINVWAYTSDVPNMFKKYVERHPDFAAKYELYFTQVSTDNGAYQSALDSALAGYDDQIPDIYMAEEAFVSKYTNGSASKYACTYEDLGISVEKKIREAGIATYVADVTRRDGEVVALTYEGCGCAFIYNREVARDVFGDDRPETVEAALGSDWETFFDAAEKCKEKGYAIVSGDGDIWRPVANSADMGWVVDGQLYIDPKREAFLDYSKRLAENDYTNGTLQWFEEWFSDMAEVGPKKVLGFYGPSWFLNYTIADHCSYGDLSTYGDWGVCKPNFGSFWGGTWLIANKKVLDNETLRIGVKQLIEYVTLDTSDSGLQYQWANGTLDQERYGDIKEAVASDVVMGLSFGSLDILNGQNAYPTFSDAADLARGDNRTEYDEWINQYWLDAARMYANGELTRDGAIQWFKNQMRDSGYFRVD